MMQVTLLTRSCFAVSSVGMRDDVSGKLQDEECQCAKSVGQGVA